MQRADPDINTALLWLDGTLPNSLSKDESSTTQTLWHQRQQLVLKDGILFRLYKDIPRDGLNKRLQLIVPKQVATTQLHNS